VGVALCNSTHRGRVHAVSPRARTPSIISVQSVGTLGLDRWLTPTRPSPFQQAFAYGATQAGELPRPFRGRGAPPGLLQMRVQ
jgi:hypothetical protein